ncbi:MAG: hypothetical protein EOO15_14200 [Chitinophagaceae bacterium]|nr:MAG: hypothetical protein EOO15_14200 [Chitinophagaceae bacterium]
MNNPNLEFLEAHLALFDKVVFTAAFPEAMKASEVDADGWVSWKPLPGTLHRSDYTALEQRFGVQYPESFIEWHRAYFFLDADCTLLRLPASNPAEPLRELEERLDWYVGEKLIAQKIYPFGDDGNDAGPLVFDGRTPAPGNEFPIRIYDHEFDGDLKGLSPIIFSSFPKLLECMTHYLQQKTTLHDYEIIPDFFRIDPDGAGNTGVDYWMGFAGMPG